MTPTLTAPDPAIFPADVLAFAAERGVTDYLVPLYELAKKCFAGADIAVKFESDGDIPALSWIAYVARTADWDMDRYRAAYDRWIAGFIALCPSEDSINFTQGLG